MKAHFYFLVGCLAALWLSISVANAQAPIDTTGGRYYQPIFPAVTVTSGVVYGSAINFLGSPQTLLMDVYQPTGDAAAERPVIIFAHQGGFVTGSRTDQYMVDVCTRFARLGYVTASIDYRLLFFPVDTVNVARAAIRGGQDMKAAIRFFRRDAATANTYRVSPSRVVAAGASAGGFMALEAGYLDKDSEVPVYVGIAALGGVEGNSGNPGYSSLPLAVLNLSGATERPDYIEPGNPPLYSIHGTADGTVPYNKGRVGASLPPKYVYGSGLLHPYANSIGVPNVLRRLSSAPHIPQYNVTGPPTATQQLYADTTFRDIRNFLRPLLVPVTAAYPSLVINVPTTVPGGSYQDITINSSQALLAGNITVYGTLVVKSLAGQTPGSLKTNCFVVDGPGNFDLQAGASLRICDAAGIAASGATGAIRNTGARSFSVDAGYVYEGTTSQTTGLGLPATVRALEVAVPTTNAVTLSAPLNISQLLTPTSGTLTTGGRALTLLSSPAGTASAAAGPGTVNGTLSVQRYLDPSVNAGLGYRHLASPLDNTTAAGLATGSFTPVLNTAYNTAARPDLVQPFPTVFGYDQTRALTSPVTSYGIFDKGWVVPAAADLLTRGRGYAVNLTAGQTLSFSGPLTRNNEDIAVTLPAAASAAAGWHLLGNPFPSAFSWDGVTVPAGVGSAMYTFVSTSQYGGQYRAYVNGMGGAAATVPLGQGFFVRSLASAPATLTFPAAARISSFTAANATTVQRGTADLRPRLHLALAAAANPATADDTYLYLEAGATAAPDLRFDASKLANPSGLNLATIAAGEALAINGLPLLTATTIVPLSIAVPQPGTYALTAAELMNFSSNVTLYDALSGTHSALVTGTRYAFTLAGTTAPGRFSLELRPAGALATTGAAALAAQLQLYPNPATSSFHLALPAPSKSTAAVPVWLTNTLGQRVAVRQFSALAGQPFAAEFDVRGLAPGIYQLHLTWDGTTLVKQVVVQ